MSSFNTSTNFLCGLPRFSCLAVPFLTSFVSISSSPPLHMPTWPQPWLSTSSVIFISDPVPPGHSQQKSKHLQLCRLQLRQIKFFSVLTAPLQHNVFKKYLFVIKLVLDKNCNQNLSCVHTIKLPKNF